MESVTNANTGEYQLPSRRVPYQSTAARLDSEWRIVCMWAECWTDTEESKAGLQKESCGLPEEMIQERRAICMLCNDPYRNICVPLRFPIQECHTVSNTLIDWDKLWLNKYTIFMLRVLIWTPWLLSVATLYLSQFLPRHSKNLGWL